jgi:hypothetical protein
LVRQQRCRTGRRERGITASRPGLHGPPPVTLRLASSSDDRALAIRDHLLPLLRAQGALEVQRDMVRVVELRLAEWTVRHWTPFNELTYGEAASPGYRHAIERQRAQSNLPYGLEVWHEMRVLRILWADDGAFDVAEFVRGAWEDAALAL